VQENELNVSLFSREELEDAQRTNKPSGKCHYSLMISKTCKEAKSVPARGGAPKEEYLFINAEEEFFYEVTSRVWDANLTFDNIQVLFIQYLDNTTLVLYVIAR